MKREIIYVHIIKRRGKTWFRSKRPTRVRGSGGGGEGVGRKITKWELFRDGWDIFIDGIEINRICFLHFRDAFL